MIEKINQLTKDGVKFFLFCVSSTEFARKEKQKYMSLILVSL